MTAGAGGGEQQDGGRSDVEMDGGETRRRTAASAPVFMIRTLFLLQFGRKKEKASLRVTVGKRFFCGFYFPLIRVVLGMAAVRRRRCLFFPLASICKRRAQSVN